MNSVGMWGCEDVGIDERLATAKGPAIIGMGFVMFGLDLIGSKGKVDFVVVFIYGLAGEPLQVTCTFKFAM